MISLIVCSYDGYSDCWDPYFKMLVKYFPQAKDFDIILSTTTKDYHFEGLDITVLKHGNDAPWGKRLIESLKIAKYDIVFPLSEDYFLRSPMNFKMFKHFVELMEKNDEVDFIRMLRYSVRWSDKPSKYNFLNKIEPTCKHRFLLIPGLWKKKTISKYIKDYENIYMSEKINGIRSWIYKDEFYAISEEYVNEYGQLYDTWNSGFIFKGKWPVWCIESLESENLNIDYSIRGSIDNEGAKKTRVASKIAIIKSPFTSSKSFLNIIGLYIKSLFVKL
ncbi:hypothetical protein FF125_12095 [Aureibaculum algae]|uniref:Glycosyltransferase family 2 protein n=1 Tax=Aureibaculum algae TaxID=2584122 RepID=A0A5B7TUY8_9FLAO|nr:hypothetical protein [Aureibaculum algae]QCX39141.1 hypothetical protein FF125_12095 [Aureibaculum algae]